MSDPSQSGRQDDQDKPLSPEALAIYRRARRSFAISMGILLLGFIAIAFALVYRVMRDAPPETVVAEVSVPAGAEVLSAVLAEGALNVTYREGEDVRLIVFDAASGAVLREIAIAGE